MIGIWRTFWSAIYETLQATPTLLVRRNVKRPHNTHRTHTKALSAEYNWTRRKHNEDIVIGTKIFWGFWIFGACFEVWYVVTPRTTLQGPKHVLAFFQCLTLFYWLMGVNNGVSRQLQQNLIGLCNCVFHVFSMGWCFSWVDVSEGVYFCSNPSGLFGILLIVWCSIDSTFDGIIVSRGIGRMHWMWPIAKKDEHIFETLESAYLFFGPSNSEWQPGYEMTIKKSKHH